MKKKVDKESKEAIATKKQSIPINKDSTIGKVSIFKLILRFLKHLVVLVPLAIIAAFVFPIAFMVLAYVLIYVIRWIFALFAYILGYLFSFNAVTYLADINSAFFFGALNRFFEFTLYSIVPGVRDFVYMPQTRPFVVTASIVICLGLAIAFMDRDRIFPKKQPTVKPPVVESAKQQ